MKFKTLLLYLFILLFIPSINIHSQQPGDEEKLKDLFDDIIRSKDNEERKKLNKSIEEIIDRYVESDNVFSHRFENLRYLGQILSPDSKLKIITWNLLLTDGTNEYHCYLLRKERKKSPVRVYKLKGNSMDDPPETDRMYKAEEWYGALYYAVQPFRKNRNIFYVLLGLDNTSLEVSTKIIDVLTFTGEGDIKLGMDCFIKGDKSKFRDLLVYSADGVVSLRFENKRTIIFDHLVPVSQTKPGIIDQYVPEFSFDAYVLKKGNWIFVENIEPRIRK